MNVIAAADKNCGIGFKGDLLVKIPEDMKYFRKMTIGKVCVMGRKTLESFPGGKPLPDRVNIVLSSSKREEKDGVIWVKDIAELFDELKKYSEEDVFVIGGGTVYSMLIPYCHRAYITEINNSFEADTYIFDFKNSSDWRLKEKGDIKNHNGIEFSFDVYEKIK